jgi:hypothetical protein
MEWVVGIALAENPIGSDFLTFKLRAVRSLLQPQG